jgi:hypothetical protein
MADEAITTGSNIAGSYVAAGVTQLARRKGWVIALSVAGFRFSLYCYAPKEDYGKYDISCRSRWVLPWSISRKSVQFLI